MPARFFAGTSASRATPRLSRSKGGRERSPRAAACTRLASSSQPQLAYQSRCAACTALHRIPWLPPPQALAFRFLLMADMVATVPGYQTGERGRPGQARTEELGEGERQRSSLGPWRALFQALWSAERLEKRLGLFIAALVAEPRRRLARRCRAPADRVHQVQHGSCVPRAHPPGSIHCKGAC